MKTLIARLGKVLIPLLVDDPLWVNLAYDFTEVQRPVLIPLLVDDPLWVLFVLLFVFTIAGLNPSFSG